MQEGRFSGGTSFGGKYVAKLLNHIAATELDREIEQIYRKTDLEKFQTRTTRHLAYLRYRNK